jgi:hypothetical protein
MEILRIAPPSLSAFRREYQAPRRPVILTGLMDDWPARRWSLDDLRGRYGDRMVTAVPTQGGQVVHSARGGVPYAPVRFGDYLDLLEGAEPPGSYLIFPVGDVLPELMREFVLPVYCRDAPWFRARFWMSGADTGSPLHHDVPDNLFAQIFGRKRFVLFAPGETWNLYPEPPWSGTPNYSRADAERPDYRRFPRLLRARSVTCEVGPGEVLYLPRYWWHQVTTLERSASVNLWWAEGLNAAVARAGQAFMRLRKLSL